MHIHIQNRPNDHFVPLTADLVQKVTADSGHRFTISDDDAGFGSAMPTAEVLVTTADQLHARFPHAAPRLKAAFLKHAGVDSLVANNPLPPAVMLLNNSGAHARKAGEYAQMATLMLRAGIHKLMSQQRKHLWQPHFTSTLAGTRITILGVGGLGSAAAKSLRPHGVQLTGIRNSPEPHSDFDETLPVGELDSVLPRTDILILTAPLTPSTRKIIGARQFKLLPIHAGIINIARGELIDEPALIKALEDGQIAGAILDVTTTEPLPKGDALWDAPNLVITPHVAATDITTYAAETLRILLDNLDDIACGRKPRNLVDLQRGY